MNCYVPNISPPFAFFGKVDFLERARKPIQIVLAEAASIAELSKSQKLSKNLDSVKSYPKIPMPLLFSSPRGNPKSEFPNGTDDPFLKLCFSRGNRFSRTRVETHPNRSRRS